MKKALLFLFVIVVACVGGIYGYNLIISSPDVLPTFVNKQPPPDGNYVIKKSGKVIDELKNKNEAIKKAEAMERSVVIDKNNNKWVYSSLSPFLIITDSTIHDFDVFESALRYAKKNDYHKIYYNNDSKPIWSDQVKLPEKKKLDVPVIMQMPELPRGCEVTALAMLLNYNGKDVSKMELARKIKKDTTPQQVDSNGRIINGNPYDGFVGNMYDVKQSGYGVYHGPISELARSYFKEKVLDLSGLEFDDLLYFISNGHPVWVITNVTYKPLEESYFQMWHTPTGIVKVTNKLHSVVITGYDKNNVYVNDPLSSSPNKTVNKLEFQKSWEQMGNQAVCIIK